MKCDGFNGYSSLIGHHTIPHPTHLESLFETLFDVIKNTLAVAGFELAIRFRSTGHRLKNVNVEV